MANGHPTMTSKLKRLSRERGWACEECGHDGALEVHHIKPWFESRDNTDRNLRLLCIRCHFKAHGRKVRKEESIRFYDAYHFEHRLPVEVSHG